MLSEFLGAMIRRWYVVLIGLIATVVLGYGALTLHPPDYKARGLVVLLPPTSTVGTGGNPFLGLGDLELPAGVLVTYFSSATAQAEVAKVAPHATVVVSMEDSTRGPVIAIDVKAPTAKEAESSLDFVANSIPATLDRLQREVNAPKYTDVRSLSLALDNRAHPDRKGAIRLTILAVGVGLSGTGFLVFSIDGMVRRRADLRRAAAASTSTPAPERPAPKRPAPERPARKDARIRAEESAPEAEVAKIAKLRAVAQRRPTGTENAARKRG